MHFFATREDLTPVIRDVEATLNLRYSEWGSFPGPTFPAFDSAFEIPRLGIANKESAIVCRRFLVTLRETKVAMRKVHRDVGEAEYLVDEYDNPDAISFAPGGVFRGEVLLYGRFATVSPNKDARMLLRRFDSKLRKHFVKIGGFYVGPEAVRLKNQGMRLTLAVQSSRSFDLV